MDSTGNVTLGQAEVPAGHDYRILKFDGVIEVGLGEPGEYGHIEIAYYRIATAAGISMTACRLREENSRAHFKTQRFDRIN